MNKLNYYHQRVTKLNTYKTQEKHLKNIQLEIVKLLSDDLRKQYVKSSVLFFCPVAAMTSHKQMKMETV